MRRVLVVLAMLFFATGCASGFNVEDHAVDLCDVYESVRPDVVEAREIIAADFTRFPPSVKAMFLRIDKELPKLDNAGQAVCQVARLGGSAKSVDWEQVTSVVIKGVSLAAKLRAEGVI